MVTLADAKAKAKELRKTLRQLESLTRPGSVADRHRDRMAERSRDATAKIADIGAIPAVANPERREAARNELLYFLQTYFPNSTGLSPFSDDHKRVIARIERCIVEGGRFCNAVYRGFAKTTISQNAALWSVLFGYRRYAVVFGATDGDAQRNILAIKLELSDNDLLAEDFPEVCHAVKALEGKPQRCASQTCQGTPTHIQWKADQIVLPTIAGSVASGAVLTCRGLTAASRGMVFKNADGTNQRPDFVIVDDPQTDESASTPLQVSKRLDILKRSILKLAGHNRQIACVVNATVISRDDMIEQLLDPKRNPTWQGERIKMVRKWADTHDTLWMNDYARLRTTFNRDDPDDQRRAKAAANELYAQRRTEMDAGCVVSWEHCYDRESEASAIQHAYNLLIDDGADIFATECQNEPRVNAQVDAVRLSAGEIITRLNGFKRFEFPREVEHLSCFIDVQDAALYYAVCGWAPDFTGYVLDYGAWPEQLRRYYRLSDISPTLATAFPGPQETQWYEGLRTLCESLTGRQWTRADGVAMKLGRIIIDANYGVSTRVVKRFCQVSPWSQILTPAHGRGVRAGDVPMNHYPVKPGERRGHNWILRPDAEATGQRHVLYDGNYWKSFIHARLRPMHPARCSLSLWGDDPRQHEMIADHLAAESPVRTEGRGRTVDQWELPANRPDNHLLDCLVGCCVGAAMLGAAMAEHQPKARNTARIPLSEMGRRR